MFVIKAGSFDKRKRIPMLVFRAAVSGGVMPFMPIETVLLGTVTPYISSVSAKSPSLFQSTNITNFASPPVMFITGTVMLELVPVINIGKVTPSSSSAPGGVALSSPLAVALCWPSVSASTLPPIFKVTTPVVGSVMILWLAPPLALCVS